MLKKALYLANFFTKIANDQATIPFKINRLSIIEYVRDI